MSNEPANNSTKSFLDDLTKIELGTLHDRKITLFGVPDDHITTTILRTKTFYEWSLLTSLESFVGAGDLVVDVGANIGNHAIFLAASRNTRVVAFEPQPQIAEVLQRNVEYNFLDNSIEIRRRALGQSTGSAKEKIVAGNLGATKMEVGEGNIKVSTLDNEVFSDRISLLKVDAEGMDIDVLRGGRQVIERDRPVISCEVASAHELSELTRFVTEIGYTFAGKYNATPTYLLLPYRSAEEVAVFNRYHSTNAVNTNLMARDHHYRINVLTNRIASLEERIAKLEASL